MIWSLRNMCVVLVVAATSSAFGQTFRPVGEQYRDVSAVLQDLGAKSVVYLPVGKEDRQLFYIPFFAMKADKDGKLDVAVLNGPTPTTSLVAVWLLLSPQNTIEAIARYIRSEENRNPDQPRFRNVQASQLIGIPFANLEITERKPGIGFQQVSLTNYSAQGEIQLVAEVPAAEADTVANDLRERKRLPVFNVRYDLSARQTVSQSEFQVSSIHAWKTDAAKNLLGSKTASEKYGWHVDSSKIQLQQPFVTRDQRNTFEGRMTSELRAQIRLEDDRDFAWFNQFRATYFDQVFKQAVIDTEKTPLGQQLAYLSTYDFDPKDLKADEVNKIVTQVQNFFRQENADEKKFNVNLEGSASVLGIVSGGLKAGVEYDGKTLRKMMEDHGWKFAVEGKFYVPKQLQVHIIDTKALKSGGTLNMEVSRRGRLFTQFTHQVSTRNLYYPQTGVDHLVALEELRTGLTQLRGEMREEQRKGLAQLRGEMSYAIQFKELPNLDGNIDTPYDTGYSDKEWQVGIVGFQTHGGDINEQYNRNSHIIWAWPTVGANGNWHVPVDFLSHYNRHERWTVKVVAIRRGILTQ